MKHDEVATVLLALDLLDHGVFVNPVIPPAVNTEMGLMRLSLMVDHDASLLEEAADTLRRSWPTTVSFPRKRPRSAHRGDQIRRLVLEAARSKRTGTF